MASQLTLSIVTPDPGDTTLIQEVQVTPPRRERGLRVRTGTRAGVIVLFSIPRRP